MKSPSSREIIARVKKQAARIWKEHVPGRDAGHVAGLSGLAEPELDAEIEVGPGEGLLDLVAVDEDVGAEQDRGAERHLLVTVEDLEALARAGRLQRVCDRLFNKGLMRFAGIFFFRRDVCGTGGFFITRKMRWFGRGYIMVVGYSKR